MALVWLRPYVKVRQAGRIVSVAVIIAVGVTDGRREILGMDIGPSEAGHSGPSSCASSLAVAAGVKLVISDAHEGLKAACQGLSHVAARRVPERPARPAGRQVAASHPPSSPRPSHKGRRGSQSAMAQGGRPAAPQTAERAHG